MKTATLPTFPAGVSLPDLWKPGSGRHKGQCSGQSHRLYGLVACCSVKLQYCRCMAWYRMSHRAGSHSCSGSKQYCPPAGWSGPGGRI